LYFVYIPQYDHVIDGHSSETRDSVFKIIRDLDIKIIDFEYSLSKSIDPHQYYPHQLYSHLNKKGYKLLGEQIAAQMANYKRLNTLGFKSIIQ